MYLYEQPVSSYEELISCYVYIMNNSCPCMNNSYPCMKNSNMNNSFTCMSFVHEICAKKTDLGVKRQPCCFRVCSWGRDWNWQFLQDAGIHINILYIYIDIHIYIYIYIYTFIYIYVQSYSYSGIFSYIYVIFRHVTSHLTSSDMTFWPFSGCSDIDWMNLGADSLLFVVCQCANKFARCMAAPIDNANNESKTYIYMCVCVFVYVLVLFFCG